MYNDNITFRYISFVNFIIFFNVQIIYAGVYGVGNQSVIHI